MRIGLVSYEYPPQQGLGGVGTYMFRLAGALGGAGHEVHVITGPSDLKLVEQRNVFVHRVAAEFDLGDAPRAVRWAYWHGVGRPMSRANPMIWHWMRWNLACQSVIRRVDEEVGFDVVEGPEHAGNAWAAGRVRRWPMVVRVHCPWEMFVRINREKLGPMNRMMAWMERRAVARCADVVTVPSLAMKRVVEKSWKARRTVRVVPNMMDVSDAPGEIPGDGGVQKIVCTGRIEPLKGQDTLAVAFRMIARKYPRAELWIIGPDRWRGARFAEVLRKLVPDEGVRARIKMPGLVSLKEIEGHLRGARVAVVGSVGFESFSYSALEAMAAGRPLVVTATGALTELVRHEREGLVVSGGDAHEMASAMDRLLSDRELSERCGRGAWERARSEFDTSVVLPRMMEAYEEARGVYCGRRGRELPVVSCQLPVRSAHWTSPGPLASSDVPGEGEVFHERLARGAVVAVS